MKRLLTLLMLVLFLLNVVGYYGIFMELEAQSGREVTSSLDDDQFSKGGMFTFKMPMTLPYAIDSKDYERVDGNFEYEGNVYRLVQQKLYRDTLYIMCMKDNRSSSLNQALADYVKTFTDKPSDGKQEVKPFQNFSKDYLSTEVKIQPVNFGWVRHTSLQAVAIIMPASLSYSIDQPPRL